MDNFMTSINQSAWIGEQWVVVVCYNGGSVLLQRDHGLLEKDCSWRGLQGFLQGNITFRFNDSLLY